VEAVEQYEKEASAWMELNDFSWACQVVTLKRLIGSLDKRKRCPTCGMDQALAENASLKALCWEAAEDMLKAIAKADHGWLMMVHETLVRAGEDSDANT
jgi:hypothetical protein